MNLFDAFRYRIGLYGQAYGKDCQMEWTLWENNRLVTTCSSYDEAVFKAQVFWPVTVSDRKLERTGAILVPDDFTPGEIKAYPVVNYVTRMIDYWHIIEDGRAVCRLSGPDDMRNLKDAFGLELVEGTLLFGENRNGAGFYLRRKR